MTLNIYALLVCINEYSPTAMGGSIVNLFLDETDGDEVVHTFKLIVSTEEVADCPQAGVHDLPSIELFCS